MTHDLLLTGGGDWERFTFAGACNEPLPYSWKNACRRRLGHYGSHHTWDPRTGTDRGRHPRPYVDGPSVWAWDNRHRGDARMLVASAYVAPRTSECLMVEAIKGRERAA